MSNRSKRVLSRLGRLRGELALAISGALIVGALAAPNAGAFGIASFDLAIKDQAGQPELQAGGRPFEVETRLFFDQVGPFQGPNGSVKTIEVDLPLGFVGNPSALPTCTALELSRSTCSPSSQVGTITPFVLGEFPLLPEAFPGVFNMEQPPRTPARFGLNVAGAMIMLDAKVRPSDNGITLVSRNTTAAVGMTGSELTMWGVPADPVHNPERWCGNPNVPLPEVYGCSAQLQPTALLANPTNCSSEPMTTVMRADGWDNRGVFDTAVSTGSAPLHGCELLEFDADSYASPASTRADSPTAIEVGITVPQNDSPNRLATSHLKDVEVEFPEGMSVNPSSANGLGSCSPAEIGLGTNNAVRCPDSSKLGTVEVDTPLLPEPLGGHVYLAEQGNNPFGSLLALYVVAEGPGVVVKLPGRVETDPATGKLTASFEDNPQLPFETMRVRLKGGSRAALLTPRTCGTYTTKATLTPWSGNAPVVAESSFQVTSGPNGGPCPTPGQFNPAFEAGTVTPIAGAHSPLVVNASRPDGSAPLTGVAVKLPRGLLGTLAGVSTCSDAALSAAAGRSGADERANPSCPASSRVGTVDVGAGGGSTPLHVEGAAYLAGPYKGAPLSMAIVTPAVAGPFDLGTVVVRASMSVDPRTAEISVKSDPIPQILQGIPLAVRSASVRADRPQFTFNPTSCDPMAIDGTLFSPSASLDVSNRFQVGACAALGFKPNLRLNLIGGTKRGAHPKLRAVLTARPGDANIGRASVALPKAVFLDQGSIGTVCTRVQFAADACPEASVYGTATAITPILDEPLTGPVYLRSSDNALPDLVAALKGPADKPVEVELVGRIDSVKGGGIRNTFDAVPDAPVTKFVLEMRGGPKQGLVELSRDICAHPYRLDVKLDSQSGRTHDTRPLMRNGKCAKGRKGKKRTKP